MRAQYRHLTYHNHIIIQASFREAVLGTRGQYLERFVRLTNSLGPRYLRFEYIESFVI